jgi:uncharacterized membrane protein
MKDKVKSLLTSRRFWVAGIGLVTVVSSELFGVSLDHDQLLSVAGIVVAWVIGDTIRETK